MFLKIPMPEKYIYHAQLRENKTNVSANTNKQTNKQTIQTRVET